MFGDHSEKKLTLPTTGMNLKSKIKERSSQLHEELKRIRHHLHAHPELSFEEHHTAAFIEKELTDLGLAPERKAGTGVIALLKGKKTGGKTIALRADTDALPITEISDRPYISKNPGIMHACGHDVHTTSLLGAARILKDLENEWAGEIRLIFQPGEEKLPGGASLMIQENVLKNPVVSSIIGQHVMPLLPVGTVGFRSGLYMASTDEIYLTVKGKGGHGAMPQMNTDPVLIAAHIIVSLQQIVSRAAHPAVPTVLSFGKVIANGATNIIPDEVRIEGTFRTLDEEWRATAKIKIKEMAENIAKAMGGEAVVDIQDGYPFLRNDPALAERSRKKAAEYLGAENVHDLDIWMAAEDFAFYSHHVPACFYRLGIRNEKKGIVSSVHTPTFDIDEDALPIGAGLMAWLAINECSESINPEYTGESNPSGNI
jgi:amidohydrolase